jgi:hypothetical protein
MQQPPQQPPLGHHDFRKSTKRTAYSLVEQVVLFLKRLLIRYTPWLPLSSPESQLPATPSRQNKMTEYESFYLIAAHMVDLCPNSAFPTQKIALRTRPSVAVDVTQMSFFERPNPQTQLPCPKIEIYRGATRAWIQ